MCISDLFDANFCPRQDLLPKIGITWREVYTSSIKQFRQLMPTEWSIPSVLVGSWGKSASLQKLSPMPYVPQRQPSSVLKSFWASRLPPFLKDFAYQALWAKLKVGDRLQNWTKFPWCPICANLETVEHALSHCRFHAMAADTIDYCWGPLYVEGVRHAVRALPLKHSFSRPRRIAKWSAQAAHWSLRKQVKN